MHAQTVEAAAWWQRPRLETQASWIGNYQKSLKNRHRDVIVAAVQGLGDVRTVLELGCHCGPNLVRLAAECPSLEMLTGVDVNVEAVQAGQAWMQVLGLTSRVELIAGRVPDATDSLPDGCVDVVLTCYALAYIAPPDLDAVLWELGRLARRAVILAEPMSATDSRAHLLAVSGYREWAHNYAGAQRWLSTWQGMTSRIVPIEPPVDRLASVLIAARPDATIPTTPSESPTP